MEPTFLIDQMERLRAQAELETDPVLRKEHQKTLRHLHRQIRKATTHRSAWFGFLRIVVPLCGMFLLTLWAVTKITKTYGKGSTIEAGAITIVAFVIITVTMLVLLKAISPEIYSSVVGEALSAVKSFKGSTDGDAKKLPVNEKSALPGSLPSSGELHNPPKVSFDLSAASELKPPDAEKASKLGSSDRG